MRTIIIKKKSMLLILSLFSLAVCSQENKIDWISFEQLEDSLSIHPKKVFIDFYADWCVYCKKMDKVTFKDPDIIAILNQDYYAVKMDAETLDTIVFGGDVYLNQEIGKKRNPTHDIPLLLATRKNRPFSLPAIVILDEKFQIVSRYFEYLSPNKMGKAIEK